MRTRKLQKTLSNLAQRARLSLQKAIRSILNFSKRYRWALAFAWLLAFLTVSLYAVETRMWWFLLGILPFAWLAVEAAMSRQGKQSTILNLVLTILASLLVIIVGNYIYPNQSELPHLVTLYSQQINNKVDDVSSKVDRLTVEMRRRGIEPAGIKEKMDLLYKECYYNLAGCASERLRKWREIGQITAGEKEILDKTIDLLLSYGDQIAKEAEKLRKEGNDDYAQFLESLAKLQAQGNASGIRKLAEQRVQEYQEKVIRELHTSIQATQTLLSFKETIILYNYLLKYENTYTNYINYINYIYMSTSNLKKLSLLSHKELEKLHYWFSLLDEENIKNTFNTQDEFNNAIKDLLSKIKLLNLMLYKHKFQLIARAATEEGAEIYLPSLAAVLNDLGVSESELGRWEKALEMAQQAVAYYRELTSKDYEVLLPHLAISLNNLGVILFSLGNRKDALETTKEAIYLLTQHFLLYPEVYSESMQVILENYFYQLNLLKYTPDSILLCPLTPQLDRLPVELRDLITPLCKARDSLE